MTQYKVPQNVDMQDKIMGPLTLYQFLYLLIGGMIFYSTLKSPGAVDLIFIGLPVGALSLAFAFVKINDQPFSRFLISIIYFLTHPKIRKWQHSSASGTMDILKKSNKVNTVITRKELDQQKLQEVSQNLDTQNSQIYQNGKTK